MFKVELFCMDRKKFFHKKKIIKKNHIDISTLHRKTGRENRKCPEKTGCLVTPVFCFFCTLFEVTSCWESQTKPATGF